MYPTLFTTPGMKAFAEEIDAERGRQLAKWGDQRHPDGTGDAAMFGMPMTAIAQTLKGINDELRPSSHVIWTAADSGQTLGPSRPQWLPILLEEVFEAASETDPDRLRVELIQVAAVCAAWLYDLDRRPGSPS